MIEIFHRFIEAFKSSSFPIILFAAVHSSSYFLGKNGDYDIAPGDNFPQLKG
jgi:hypothetical protein